MHDTQMLKTYSQDFTDALFQVFTRERNNRNMTLDDVYSKLEIHQATYYRWKNGQTPLSEAIIEKLASILDISGRELEALTKCQMNLNENGTVHPDTNFSLKVSKLSTSIDLLSKAVRESRESLFYFFKEVARACLLEDLNQPENTPINNYSFPYHCLNNIASNAEDCFIFTLALSLCFSAFPDDIDMKKDIEKIITKNLKTATIPSNLKKWTTLSTLVQFRNYYFHPESVKHEVHSLNYELRKYDDRIEYVEKSSLIFAHDPKKEANYELIYIVYFYFSNFSKEDLKIIFNYLFSFLLLSEKKQEKLSSELHSFCASKCQNL